MQVPILVFLTLLMAGAATALQGPTNARLVTAVGSPVNAAFISFAVGTVALGCLALALQTRPDVGATSPARSFSSVVLPAPFGPLIATRSGPVSRRLTGPTIRRPSGASQVA